MQDRTEDIDLIARIANGDRNAMKRFYEKHHGALAGYLRGQGPDPATVADVVQDTMLEVWRTPARFRGEAAPKTWVFTIARNRLIDRTRKNMRLRFVDEVPDEIDDTPNPEAIAESLSEANRLRKCLDTLKAAHRTVLRLAFFEDLSYQDIAKVEGLAEGTVKTRVFHAKKLMLHCLAQS